MRLALLLVAFLLAGCAAAPSVGPAPVAPTSSDASSLRPTTAKFSGTALATPLQSFNVTFPFDVPDGAVGVNGTLLWNDPAARFRMTLVDARGEVASQGYSPGAGRIVVATVEPPHGGKWSFRVGSDLAANVPFALDAVAELIVPDHNVLTKNVPLGPNEAWEVNVIMEKDASFAFAFNASAPVKWDVHSHPAGGVKEWQTGDSAKEAGAFTAPEREIYSMLFQSGAQPSTSLDLKLDGKFRVHSHN